MLITIDFETRSRADLRKVGTSVYARHPSTEVLCLAYKLPGDYKARGWTRGEAPPEDLFDAIASGLPVEGHNVFFERNIWLWVCTARLEWPDVPFDQWRCSMAACSRLTLPRGLADAGAAIGATVEKDKEGRNIMLRLCKPLATGKRKGEFDEAPAKHKRLLQYCLTDVDSEDAISSSIQPLTASELRVWQLDQRINLRGLAVDRPAIENAVAMVAEVAKRDRAELAQITAGKVGTPQELAKITEFVEEDSGIKVKSLAAESVKRLLEGDELTETSRRVLEIRRNASKASTAKLRAMLERCDEDGRVRGNLVYHGAATGRWAGSGIQIQNFPRGGLSETEIDTVHALLPAKDPEPLDLIIDNPLDCLSGSLRSMIIAEPGNRLMVCDFASIEARVLAWVAHQDDLVEQFRNDVDVYIRMASKIYDVPEEEVVKAQRHVGKTAILGLGYGMGWKTFRSACKVMAGVDISGKLARKTVSTYREANDNIKAFWASIGTAAIETVKTQKPHRVGRVELNSDGQWLTIRLPSGRKLHYYRPALVDVVAPWSKGLYGDVCAGQSQEDYLEDLGIRLGERDNRWLLGCSLPPGSIKRLMNDGISLANVEKKEPKLIKQVEHWGVNSRTRKWSKIRTYGGKLTENVVQAIARDFLAESMLRIESAGYPIVATVHDEVLSEVPDGTGSLDEFERIMRQIPTWGRGCPIDVEGFEAKRYRK